MLLQAIDFINNHLMPISATLAAVLEIVLRLIPSEKPLSILHFIGGTLMLLGDLCHAAGVFLNKIIPQNLK